jgi:REP element-mobilizing transposase RayT
MPRTRRLKSETGIYHVVLRGINKQTIFEDEEDNEMFLLTLDQYKQKSGYKLLAYCLMGNHVHLLMKTEDETLGQCFKRIGASYVYWYNMKYYRVGHLFQDRYKSEAVETDDYFKAVIRYIHRNPLKAGMVTRLEDYTWSSYREYLGLNNTYHVDKEFVLKLFNEDQEQAIKDFKVFNEIENDDQCLDISEKKRMSDAMAIRIIKNKFSVNSAKDIGDFDPEQKQVCVLYLLDKGMSVLQISRVTGVSRYFINESRK